METTEELDPTQPFLDHHRAGGLPLFGTSMGIATLTRAVGPGPTAIGSIGVHDPYILEGDGPHRIRIILEPGPEGTAARLIRADPRLPPMLMFDALFRTDPPATPHVNGPAVSAVGGITAAEVYAVFFPGPAFQVIAAARMDGAALISRLSDAPPLVPLQARLIEFAMQSAGLLELATSGRRMIPHRLGRIAPVIAETAELTHPIHARACYAVDGEKADITLTDATGATVMTLTGYETVPLPFPADPAIAAVMTDRLRASAA